MELMIDIEALDKRPTGIILTIGAQLFDPTSEHLWAENSILDPISGDRIPAELNIRIDVDEQEALGRTTDEDTIAWWAKQSAEAQEEAFGEEDRLSLKDSLTVLTRMAEVCGPKKSVRIWSKGPTYDIMMLENAMEQAGVRIPWSFWNVRDARTVYGLCPSLDTRKNGPISHRALDDCRQQIILLRESFNILGVTQLK
jgi:hypothetical protein